MFLGLVIPIAFLGQASLPAFGDGVVAGREDAPPRQQEVVVKYAKALVDDQGMQVDGSRHYIPYHVVRSEGERLLLSGENTEGWIASSDVLPIEQAVEFYDGEIEKHPRDASAYRFRAWAKVTRGDLKGGACRLQ